MALCGAWYSRFQFSVLQACDDKYLSAAFELTRLKPVRGDVGGRQNNHCKEATFPPKDNCHHGVPTGSVGGQATG